jgi:hypothetical protein
VLDTGPGIPGGYAGKGMPGTDKDSYKDTLFRTHGETRTRIRHTRTCHAGFDDVCLATHDQRQHWQMTTSPITSQRSQPIITTVFNANGTPQHNPPQCQSMSGL